MATNSSSHQAPISSRPLVSAPSLARLRSRRSVFTAVALVILAAAAIIYYERVYLPTRAAQASPLQTAVATMGNLTVSLNGTGILQPANQVQLGFGTSGKISTISVKPGDPVKQGQLLAQLDNTSEQVKYQQAQRALADFTSPAAIAQAQKDVATATETLTNAKYALMQVISPAVFTSQEEVATDQQALAAAQAAGGTAPTAAEQKAIDDAQARLKTAQARLAGNLIWYKDVYLPLNYTVKVPDPTAASRTHRPTKVVEGPSDVEIAQSQANYDVARTALEQAQWYLDALSGRVVPSNAGGTQLAAFQSARFAVQSAKASLSGSQILAPSAGTVLSVSAKVGDNVGSTPIMVLGDLSGLYLQTYVSEKSYQDFQVGSEADIVFDALPARTFTGKVVQVNPSLNTSGNTPVVSGLVAMDPTDAHLLIGMSAAVDVIVGRAQQAVLVPVAALHEYAPGQYAVFVMRAGKLAVDFVQVGLKDSVTAQITSGLNAGDVVSTGLQGTK